MRCRCPGIFLKCRRSETNGKISGREIGGDHHLQNLQIGEALIQGGPWSGRSAGRAVRSNMMYWSNSTHLPLMIIRLKIEKWIDNFQAGAVFILKNISKKIWATVISVIYPNF
jgi:hypothetical protein